MQTKVKINLTGDNFLFKLTAIIETENDGIYCDVALTTVIIRFGICSS